MTSSVGPLPSHPTDSKRRGLGPGGGESHPAAAGGLHRPLLDRPVQRLPRVGGSGDFQFLGPSGAKRRFGAAIFLLGGGGHFFGVPFFLGCILFLVCVFFWVHFVGCIGNYLWGICALSVHVVVLEFRGACLGRIC